MCVRKWPVIRFPTVSLQLGKELRSNVALGMAYETHGQRDGQQNGVLADGVEAVK